jgi:hypothetical protein
MTPPFRHAIQACEQPWSRPTIKRHAKLAMKM